MDRLKEKHRGEIDALREHRLPQPPDVGDLSAEAFDCGCYLPRQIHFVDGGPAKSVQHADTPALSSRYRPEKFSDQSVDPVASLRRYLEGLGLVVEMEEDFVPWIHYHDDRHFQVHLNYCAAARKSAAGGEGPHPAT